MSIRNPSITYLITSVGRETLKDTLRSLHGQFAFGLDKIKLYFDGRCEMGEKFFDEEFRLFRQDISWTVLNENLGYWGHAIRNKYQATFDTDYVHHMDDDDIYSQGCIPAIRNKLKTHYGKVLICKFRTDVSRIIWKKKDVIFGEIGTPSGFIFNRADVMGTWGLYHGGDYTFYCETRDKIGKENLVFDETLVVKTKPRDYGY